MELHITLIGRHNVALLDRLAAGVFDAPPMSDRLRSYIADPAQRLFVALHDGVVVGQLKAVIHRHPEKAPGLFIEELGVAPEAQRNGVATALVEAAFTLARNLGCAEIWLATEPGNDAAHALYRSCGMTSQHVVMYSRLL